MIKIYKKLNNNTDHNKWQGPEKFTFKQINLSNLFSWPMTC